MPGAPRYMFTPRRHPFITDAEKMRNIENAERFCEIATRFYQNEIMEYAFPLKKQNELLEEDVTLTVQTVRAVFPIAKQLNEAIANFVEEFSTASYDDLKALSIAEKAQQEAGSARTACQELEDPAKYPIDHIIHRFKATSHASPFLAGLILFICGFAVLSVV